MRESFSQINHFAVEIRHSLPTLPTPFSQYSITRHSQRSIPADQAQFPKPQRTCHHQHRHCLDPTSEKMNTDPPAYSAKAPTAPSTDSTAVQVHHHYHGNAVFGDRPQFSESLHSSNAYNQ